MSAAFAHRKTNFVGPHLDVPVGEQQVDDDIGGEQLHAVQPLLDAAQLIAQLLAGKTLPCLADLVPDGLPEVLTARGAQQGTSVSMSQRRFAEAAAEPRTPD